jgi:hypothetical protein
MKDVLVRYDGEGHIAVHQRHHHMMDQKLVIGEAYFISIKNARSHRSHNHYFAVLEFAWRTLPENIAGEFPTPEHFRKRMLIKAGYWNSTSIVLDDPQAAYAVAHFTRPIDEFSVVDCPPGGTVVTRYTAKSQSLDDMDNEEFQRSKQDVLDAAAEMLGVSSDELVAQFEAEA